MNNTFSKQLTDDEFKSLTSKLNKHLIDNKSPYALYTYSYNNLNIIIYKSKKIVIQGNCVDSFVSEFNLITGYKINVDAKYEIGSDETGVGDLFGGLVVCCVKVDNEVLNKLNEFNINDSKKLNDKYILEIYEKLISIVDYKIASLSPKKYNELNSIYNNSHILKSILHNGAHKNFDNKDSRRIIDMFAISDKKYYEYLHKANIDPIKIDIFETKAESKYSSVAIASIIARGYFLKQIEKISNKISMKIPLGAWNPKIKAFCKEFIKKYNKDALKEIIKHDFKVDLD